MNTLRTNVIIILAMIITFDVVMFLLLPDDDASRFDGYRQGNLLRSAATRPDNILVQDFQSKDYYERNADRGFDIRVNAQGLHSFDGRSFPIWSNSLGCFDIEHPRYDRYVYLAGDSTAWGYAPFEEKFGTILERITGKQVLKCGVTNTGQRHQYAKLVEITETIGILPETILVIYEANDVFNDYAHPHTTVISGWLVDSVKLDEHNQLHRTSYEDLRELVEAKLIRSRKARERDFWFGMPKAIIRNHSLTSHLAPLLFEKVALLMTAEASAAEDGRAHVRRHISSLPQEVDGRQWYLDNPFAQENKEALLAFKRFADRNHVRLIVVLMPLKRAAAERETYYEQTRLFLERNEIEFIDPAFSLVRKGIAWSDLFWDNDHHPNPGGNRILADILLEELPQVFLEPAAFADNRIPDGEGDRELEYEPGATSERHRGRPVD